MDSKRPRIRFIDAEFRHATMPASLEFAGTNFTFRAENGSAVAPTRVNVGTLYQRNGKDKVLTRAQVDPSAIDAEVNNLLGRFDWVFAIDTNTQIIDGIQVSVTVPIFIRDMACTNGRWSATLVPQDSLEFHNAAINPERIGWWRWLGGFESNNLKGTVALIVDSDLDDHDSLNQRTRELVPGYLLPSYATLIYASADAGSVEHAANKAISDCNRRANQVMRKLMSGAVAKDGYRISDVPFHGQYRWWQQSDPETATT